jgi:hypothetical protein
MGPPGPVTGSPLPFTYNYLNHIVLRVYDPLEGSGLRIPGLEDCDSCIRITTLCLTTLCELKEANCCATNRCGRRAVFNASKQVQTPVFLAVEQTSMILRGNARA